jgi:hypothetical protein
MHRLPVGLSKRWLLIVCCVLTACSTMDDVNVSHPCSTPISVSVAHIQASGAVTAGGAAVADPGVVTTVAGIINLGGDDLVEVTATSTGWITQVTRAELRSQDHVVALPAEACPEDDEPATG